MAAKVASLCITEVFPDSMTQFSCIKRVVTDAKLRVYFCT